MGLGAFHLWSRSSVVSPSIEPRRLLGVAGLSLFTPGRTPLLGLRISKVARISHLLHSICEVLSSLTLRQATFFVLEIARQEHIRAVSLSSAITGTSGVINFRPAVEVLMQC